MAIFRDVSGPDGLRRVQRPRASPPRPSTGVFRHCVVNAAPSAFNEFLTCPRCVRAGAASELHHENLEAHWRDSDDEGRVLAVSSKGGPGGSASAASVRRFENGDLCVRGDQPRPTVGLVIGFSCEDCELNAAENGQYENASERRTQYASKAMLSLSITQQKGATTHI